MESQHINGWRNQKISNIIDFIKLQYIKLGLAIFSDNMIVFAIKISNEYINVQLKMTIPTPSQHQKDIESDKI